jgi:hypothetical protein
VVTKTDLGDLEQRLKIWLGSLTIAADGTVCGAALLAGEMIAALMQGSCKIYKGSLAKQCQCPTQLPSMRPNNRPHRRLCNPIGGGGSVKVTRASRRRTG